MRSKAPVYVLGDRAHTVPQTLPFSGLQPFQILGGQGEAKNPGSWEQGCFWWASNPPPHLPKLLMGCPLHSKPDPQERLGVQDLGAVHKGTGPPPLVRWH